MAHALLGVWGMKRLLLLVVLLGMAWRPAGAQEADAPDGVPVESVEVSGLPLNQLSPGLRGEISALVGTPLNREQLEELAARIEAERPDVVAVARSIARPEARARVIFLVASISDDPRLASNINARYIVESVSISGVPDTQVSQTVRDELQTLVGSRLDWDRANHLRERLAADLPGRRVNRRISRGSQPGRIRVVFEVVTLPWIPFTPSRSKFLYHGDLGWTGVLDIAMGGDRNRVVLGLVLSDKDTLIENYRGYRLRAESRKVGSERVGASVEFSWLRQSWELATLSALASDPRIPETYRTRRTIEPSLSFAFSPRVRVTAGVSTSELESASGSQMADVMVASIGYDQRWRPASGGSHRVDAGYLLRATTDALGSDLVYKRHLAQARYRYDQGQNTVLASFSFGRITGQAPLFDRFTLGDSSTLRGWNKFDIAPAGGDYMFHQSIEYRYRHFALFFDSGSVWAAEADRRVRLSTGFGYHADRAFVTLGFPLNADEVGATFMTGVRF